MATDKKLRADSWDASLTEDQRWALYERIVRKPSFKDAIAYAEAEYGLPKCAIQTYYNFMDRMRSQAFGRKIEQVKIARAEAGKLAREQTADDTLVQAYMTLAGDYAVTGGLDQAMKLTRMALDIQKQALGKDSLALTRAKFEAQERRLNAIRDALDAGKTNAVDPAAVMAEVDKILGRRKA